MQRRNDREADWPSYQPVCEYPQATEHPAHRPAWSPGCLAFPGSNATSAVGLRSYPTELLSCWMLQQQVRLAVANPAAHTPNIGGMLVGEGGMDRWYVCDTRL